MALNGLSYSNLMPGGVPSLNTFATSSPQVTAAINTMASDMGTTSAGVSEDIYFNNGAKFTAQNSLSYGYNTGIVYGLWQYVNQAGYTDPMSNFFNQAIYPAQLLRLDSPLRIMKIASMRVSLSSLSLAAIQCLDMAMTPQVTPSMSMTPGTRVVAQCPGMDPMTE